MYLADSDSKLYTSSFLMLDAVRTKDLFLNAWNKFSRLNKKYG